MKTESFNIEISSTAIKAMVAMYHDKPLAVVRELLTNAWDSHKRAGRTSVPIDVHLFQGDSPKRFVVRDYGTGISPERMKDFCTVYRSDKRDDDEQTGFFGIGSKVPFSISDNFTVTTYYNGMKYSYLMNLTETLPVYTLIAKQETNEFNGVEVSVPVHTEELEEQLIKAFGEFYKLSDMEIRPISLIEFEKLEPEYINKNIEVYLNKDINMSHLPYNIIFNYKHNFYTYKKVGRWAEDYNIEDIKQRHLFHRYLDGLDHYNSRYRAVINVPDNIKLDIAPDREYLELNDHNTQTLNDIVKQTLLNCIRPEDFEVVYTYKKTNVVRVSNKLLFLLHPRESKFFQHDKERVWDFLNSVSCHKVSYRCDGYTWVTIEEDKPIENEFGNKIHVFVYRDRTNNNYYYKRFAKKLLKLGYGSDADSSTLVMSLFRFRRLRILFKIWGITNIELIPHKATELLPKKKKSTRSTRLCTGNTKIQASIFRVTKNRDFRVDYSRFTTMSLSEIRERISINTTTLTVTTESDSFYWEVPVNLLSVLNLIKKRRKFVNPYYYFKLEQAFKESFGFSIQVLDSVAFIPLGQKDDEEVNEAIKEYIFKDIDPYTLSHNVINYSKIEDFFQKIYDSFACDFLHAPSNVDLGFDVSTYSLPSYPVAYSQKEIGRLYTKLAKRPPTTLLGKKLYGALNDVVIYTENIWFKSHLYTHIKSDVKMKDEHVKENPEFIKKLHEKMKKSKKVIDRIVNYKLSYHESGKYRADRVLKKCYKYNPLNNRRW